MIDAKKAFLDKRNFDLITKELRDNPGVRYMVGDAKCTTCEHVHFSMTPLKPWAAHAVAGECPECREMACLFVEGKTEILQHVPS